VLVGLWWYGLLITVGGFGGDFTQLQCPCNFAHPVVMRQSSHGWIDDLKLDAIGLHCTRSQFVGNLDPDGSDHRSRCVGPLHDASWTNDQNLIWHQQQFRVKPNSTRDLIWTHCCHRLLKNGLAVMPKGSRQECVWGISTEKKFGFTMFGFTGCNLRGFGLWKMSILHQVHKLLPYFIRLSKQNIYKSRDVTMKPHDATCFSYTQWLFGSYLLQPTKDQAVIASALQQSFIG